MKGDRWTPAEDRILLKNLGKISVPEIIRRGLLPGRTAGATRRHIEYRRINRRLKYGSAWMPDEDDLLREHYPVHGPSWDGWKKLLPNRASWSVRNRASRLGLRAPGSWTPEEEELLRELYPTRAYRGRQWLEVFPRHSVTSVYSKAHYMGLQSPGRRQAWPRAARNDLKQGLSKLAEELGVSERDVARRVRELMHVFDKEER